MKRLPPLKHSWNKPSLQQSVPSGKRGLSQLRFPARMLLLTISTLLALFLVLPTRDYSPTERRYLAKPPSVTLKTLLNGELSEQVEDYLVDHFPGRNLWVGLNAYWNLLTGRNAASDILYGKDGYLIHAPEHCTTEQLEKNLSRFDALAASTGLPATLLMVPTTGDLMPDKLPAQYIPYRYAACLELAQSQCQSLAVPDLSQPLAAAAVENQICYKTDHHLTSAGCYTLYRTLCDLRGRTALAPTDYTITTYDGFHGTTWTSSGYWLTPADQLEVWDSGTPLHVTIEEPETNEKKKEKEAGTDKQDTIVADSPFFLENLTSDDLYTVFLDGNHALVHIENPAVESGTLLVIRDSYGHCVAPFLAEDFHHTILVDLRYYRYGVSALLEQYDVTELLILYGLDSLLTDTNSTWLN